MIERLTTTRHFAYYVLQSEGLVDWEVKFSTGGSICMNKSKEIILDESHRNVFDWRARQVVIHEIAHIRTWPQDTKHSSLFFGEYANLILKYLVEDENGKSLETRASKVLHSS